MRKEDLKGKKGERDPPSMSIQDTDGCGRCGEGTIDEGERKENEMKWKKWLA
jgi:hypothetical protein